jgi:hypothetical protein
VRQRLRRCGRADRGRGTAEGRVSASGGGRRPAHARATDASGNGRANRGSARSTAAAQALRCAAARTAELDTTPHNSTQHASAQHSATKHVTTNTYQTQAGSHAPEGQGRRRRGRGPLPPSQGWALPWGAALRAEKGMTGIRVASDATAQTLRTRSCHLRSINEIHQDKAKQAST